MSCEVHSVKPDPSIYKLAEIRAKVRSEEILFIDDNPKYLFPAKLRGWNTFLFETEKIDQKVETLRTNFGTYKEGFTHFANTRLAS
jgi:FMN phosphatase YigB (HAD superfamily)